MSDHAEHSDVTTTGDQVGSADRAPTPEEEQSAEEVQDSLTDSVREHEEEMMEKGANAKGEGRI
ncbi:MAG: hypothetical protein KDB24_00985 [Microthrixaceae bacterium]|nr:hypothetical protein [Microthrixaceae bacterium]